MGVSNERTFIIRWFEKALTLEICIWVQKTGRHLILNLGKKWVTI